MKSKPERIGAVRLDDCNLQDDSHLATQLGDLRHGFCASARLKRLMANSG